jgi:hypothetical protein
MRRPSEVRVVRVVVQRPMPPPSSSTSSSSTYSPCKSAKMAVARSLAGRGWAPVPGVRSRCASSHAPCDPRRGRSSRPRSGSRPGVGPTGPAGRWPRVGCCCSRADRRCGRCSRCRGRRSSRRWGPLRPRRGRRTPRGRPGCPPDTGRGDLEVRGIPGIAGLFGHRAGAALVHQAIAVVVEAVGADLGGPAAVAPAAPRSTPGASGSAPGAPGSAPAPPAPPPAPPKPGSWASS